MQRLPSLAEDAFCAYSPASQTCSGDSGGPLLGVLDIATSGVSTGDQLGIVSWASGDCGSSPATAFTNVTFYADW